MLRSIIMEPQQAQILRGLGGLTNGLRQLVLHNRSFSTPVDLFASPDDKENVESKGEGAENNLTETPRDTGKARRERVPLETSIRYLQSQAYKETYGDEPVWVPYRRNFKGQFAPKKTRKTCIRKGEIATGNPCPICRDEYLLLHFRNVALLKQFICPHSGKLLGYDKTGICRRRQIELQVVFEKAKDYGTITYDIPFREYNYDYYFKGNPYYEDFKNWNEEVNAKIKKSININNAHAPTQS